MDHVEYEALGMEWKMRGARQAEQVELLRRLWSNDLVTFEGRFHRLKDVSIVPMPVQRPIPIWFGGSSMPSSRAQRDLATVGCQSWHPTRKPSRSFAR